MNEKAAMKASVEKSRLYKHVFSTEEGKEVLYDLMANGHFLSPTYSEGSPEFATHIKEGKRRMVLYILGKIQLDGEKLLGLIQEEKSKKESFHVNIEGDY